MLKVVRHPRLVCFGLGRNHLTHDECRALYAALAEPACATHLHSLSLECYLSGRAAPDEPTSLKLLLPAFAPGAGLHALRSLKLEGDSLRRLLIPEQENARADGWPTLCNALARLPCLEQLTLRGGPWAGEHPVPVPAVQQLAVTMRLCRTLRWLRIERVGLGAAGVRALTDAFVHTPAGAAAAVRKLTLAFVGGERGGLASLAAMLRKNDTLHVLDLQGTVTDADVEYHWPSTIENTIEYQDLLGALVENTTLQHLVLPFAFDDAWDVEDTADARAVLRLNRMQLRALNRPAVPDVNWG